MRFRVRVRVGERVRVRVGVGVAVSVAVGLEVGLRNRITMGWWECGRRTGRGVYRASLHTSINA